MSVTKQEAEVEYRAYLHMAGWALDEATKIRREFDLDMSADEEQAWEREAQ